MTNFTRADSCVIACAEIYRGDGETVNVPENGILHIRMKNGTSQDIDLSRVRNISVRP